MWSGWKLARRPQRSELLTARLHRTQPISVLWGGWGVAGGETGSYLLGWEGRQLLQPGCCSGGTTKGFSRLPIGFGAAPHVHTHTRPQAPTHANVQPRTDSGKTAASRSQPITSQQSLPVLATGCSSPLKAQNDSDGTFSRWTSTIFFLQVLLASPDHRFES